MSRTAAEQQFLSLSLSLSLPLSEMQWNMEYTPEIYGWNVFSKGNPGWLLISIYAKGDQEPEQVEKHCHRVINYLPFTSSQMNIYI
jgi:hypothetical protein